MGMPPGRVTQNFILFVCVCVGGCWWGRNSDSGSDDFGTLREFLEIVARCGYLQLPERLDVTEKAQNRGSQLPWI